MLLGKDIMSLTTLLCLQSSEPAESKKGMGLLRESVKIREQTVRA